MSVYFVDILLLAILTFSAIYGWYLGTINVVGKIGAIVLAYYLARTFSTKIAAFIISLFSNSDNSTVEEGKEVWSFLSLFFDTTEVTNGFLGIIIFIIIFILVNWVVKRIAYALTSIFGNGVLSKINRAIGALIALVLMVGILIIIENIVVPTFLSMGFGDQIEEFFQRSQLIMPFLRSLPSFS